MDAATARLRKEALNWAVELHHAKRDPRMASYPAEVAERNLGSWLVRYCEAIGVTDVRGMFREAEKVNEEAIVVLDGRS